MKKIKFNENMPLSSFAVYVTQCIHLGEELHPVAITLIDAFNTVKVLSPRYNKHHHGKDAMTVLKFDEWYDLNEEKINIELAETGADRELDFDSEKEFEDRYQNYLLCLL